MVIKVIMGHSGSFGWGHWGHFQTFNLMKNALYLVLFILIAGSLGHYGLPWWSLVPFAAVAAWIFPMPAGKSFLLALVAGFLLWYSNAWLADSANEGMLSARVGLLFQGLKGWQLLLLTGLLGGILAGLGAMTGRLARDLFVGGQPKA